MLVSDITAEWGIHYTAFSFASACKSTSHVALYVHERWVVCDDRIETRAQCNCRVTARTNDDIT